MKIKDIVDFELGSRELKFYDNSKVSLEEFKTEGRTIRYFRKKDNNKSGEELKIISRSAFYNFREPFIVDPWTKILIDEANIYGTAVDDNIEQTLNYELDGDVSKIMEETKSSIKDIAARKWIWAARSQMVCDPNSLIYGEIDEVWYDKASDTYFVGDTKTSSEVDKIGYWYQIAIYVEILRQLNPDKKISSIATINWRRIKTHRWVPNQDFNENDWDGTIDYNSVKPTDPIYTAKWNKDNRLELNPPEVTNKFVERDLDVLKIIELASNDMKLIQKYDITSPVKFNQLLESNEDFKKDNMDLQSTFENVRNVIKDETKWTPGK